MSTKRQKNVISGQPEFYGDVIYKLRKNNGHTHFLTLFNKYIRTFIKRDYDPIILQRKLHVWLSTLLQLAITLSTCHARGQEGLSTL